MFASVLTATLNLSLFRCGPQDFPYHASLTGILVPVAVVISYLIYSIVVPPAFAAIIAMVLVFGTALGTRFYLVMRQHPERFQQTFHSLLMVNTFMTLLMWMPLTVIAPEFHRLMDNPEALQTGEQLNIPTWAHLASNGISIWNILANANIFRHAGEVRFGMGVIVAILLIFAVFSLLIFVLSVVGLLAQGVSG